MRSTGQRGLYGAVSPDLFAALRLVTLHRKVLTRIAPTRPSLVFWVPRASVAVMTGHSCFLFLVASDDR